MKQIGLNMILKKHNDWLRTRFDENVVGGKTDPRRANLQGVNFCQADLREVSLYGANLQGANLQGTNLRRAYLRKANLYGANLQGADLQGVDLRFADLRFTSLEYTSLQGANLRKVDLYGADLQGADLQGADLRGARLQNARNLGSANLQYTRSFYLPLTCPEKGSFTGFKCAGGYVVELEILADARRSSATGRKCRCDKAKVLSITEKNGMKTTLKQIRSNYSSDFIYKLDEIVEEPSYDTNRFNECASGIHFFITREEAVNY